MIKSLININSWRLGHLDVEANSTDFYYVRLARKLYDLIRFTEIGKDEEKYICESFAMAATYYFEDVVSGIGIWQTFTSKHKELYGKYLPFYDLNEEDYYQDEINLEDVCFLMWMTLQKEKENVFINPENPYLQKMALIIYKELDAEFEKAPINMEMLDRLKSNFYVKDFFLLKPLLFRLVNSLYLFQPFLQERLDKVEEEVKAIIGKNLEDSAIIYAVDSLVACCEKTGPLALYAKDWLAALLAYWGMKEESERIAAIKPLKLNVYLLKRYDSETICLESTEGEEYIIPRNSFEELQDSTLLKNKSFIGSLVKYDGEWQVNGLSTWSAGTKLFEAFKEKMATVKCDPIVFEKVMKVNNNHPLLYFKGYEEMLVWFSKHIGVDENFTFPEQLKKRHSFAVYVDKVKAMSIIPDGALVIKDEHNPYYSKQNAEKEGIKFIISDTTTSKEMLHYLIEHNMLPDACINSTQGLQRGKQLVQENIDFIARFMRTDDY